MKTLTTLLTLGLALLPSAAQAQDVCNDTSYQGDTDVRLDVNLYSEAEWGFRCHVTDRISNLSASENYEVEYRAAGFYVGRLMPRQSRSANRSSWKSCTVSNDAAKFTRIFPRRQASQTVNIAPACSFGWVLIPELKSLLDFFGSAKKLTASLDENDLDSGESRELMAATTSFDLEQVEGAWHYSLLVENGFEHPIEVFLDGPWTRLLGETLEHSLEPGAAVEFLLKVPVGDTGDEPAEYSASLEFDDFNEDYGAMNIPIIAPQHLGDELRGDVNGDGTLGLADAIFLNHYLFTGGAAPACHEASDFNEDSVVDLSDSIALLNHLFMGGPGPQVETADCSRPRSDVQLVVTDLPAAASAVTSPLPYFPPTSKSSPQSKARPQSKSPQKGK